MTRCVIMFLAVTLCALVLVAGVAGTADAAGTVDVIRLTENDTPDLNPQVFGDRVVWSGGASNNSEIFTWAVNDPVVRNISNRPGIDCEPQIFGGRVVWTGWINDSPYESEIFTWAVDDPVVRNISNNPGFNHVDHESQIYGDRVVWRGHLEDDVEIFTWKVGDTAPTNISNRPGPTAFDYAPQISGDRVVWQGRTDVGSDIDWEVYTWAVDDPIVRNLSCDPTHQDYGPQISGNRVVWLQWCALDYEVLIWEVGDTTPTIIDSPASIREGYPQISDDRVAWSGGVGPSSGLNYEIFFWKAGDTTPTNISNRPGPDLNPQICGDRMAWSARVDTESGADYEIFALKVGDPAPTNVSNRPGYQDRSPQVSANLVVWEGKVGTSDYSYDIEIFVAVSDPATMIGGLTSFIIEQAQTGGIDPEIQGSLLAKLDAALAALERDNPNAAKVAMNDLKALVNQVEAQSGNKIDPETATYIIEQATAIILALEE